MECAFSELLPGDHATVVDFRQANSPYRHRLLSLGVMPGTAFVVVRKAPMGDPVQIRVRGFDLCLRKHEADELMVDKR